MLLWGRVGRAGVQPGDWTMKQGARAGSGEEGTCNGRFKEKSACGVRALRPGLPPPAPGPPVSERLTGSLWPLPRLIVISARCDDAEEEEEPDGWLIFIR